MRLQYRGCGLNKPRFNANIIWHNPVLVSICTKIACPKLFGIRVNSVRGRSRPTSDHDPRAKSARERSRPASEIGNNIGGMCKKIAVEKGRPTTSHW